MQKSGMCDRPDRRRDKLAKIQAFGVFLRLSAAVRSLFRSKTGILGKFQISFGSPKLEEAAARIEGLPKTDSAGFDRKILRYCSLLLPLSSGSKIRFLVSARNLAKSKQCDLLDRQWVSA
ncbi:hypothetical protein [Microcoleus sp. herbarium7]|uniref:hypothetical protein n=1 Tax=Microcoleus sp. herbarium7 TaxID=3055435 RepID=UPI002FD0234E